MSSRKIYFLYLISQLQFPILLHIIKNPGVFVFLIIKKKKLKKGIYQVVIDSDHFKGFMNYGELILKGKSKKEVFFFYLCLSSIYGK